MKRSSAFAFAALAVCAACATLAPRTGPQLSLPVPDAGQILRSVAAAEARLDSAAIRGDAAGMAAMFADDAILVVGSDTLRGHDPIHQMLEQIRLTADSARVRFTPRTRDVCLDGAVEYGQRVDVTLYRINAPDRTLAFRYAIRWLTYGRLGVRATALVITRPQDVWTARFEDCVPAAGVRFDQHRVAVTAAVPLPLNTWSTFASINDALRQRNFGDMAPVASGSFARPSDPAAWWYDVGLRLRLWRPISVEAVVGLQPKAATSAGYRASDSTVEALSFSGGFAWAAVNYEWKRLRIGAGPFLARTSWTISEQRALFASGGPPQPMQIAKDKWNDRRYGLLLEAAYVYPVSPYVFLESQAHLRLLGKATTRGTPAFSPAEVTLNGFGLSFGAGLAY